MAATDVTTTIPRRRWGSIVRTPAGDSFNFALRFRAYGKQEYLTLGTPEDGWTEARAAEELDRLHKEVRDGTYKPWAPPEPPEAEKKFRTFAKEWFGEHKHDWRPTTLLDYEWQLRVHLLPFFKDYYLSQITTTEVDRYRKSKLDRNQEIREAAANGRPLTRSYLDSTGRAYTVNEKPLSPASINKTITRLGQILEVAFERELIDRNPVRVNPLSRKVKGKSPKRPHLDQANQIEALLHAARAMDQGAKSNAVIARRARQNGTLTDGTIAREALLATLAFSGLRISEALDLRWRDIDLSGGGRWDRGRIRIPTSKTEAGERYVDLLPKLADTLAALKARAANPHPSAIVFVSATGSRQDRNRARTRIFNPAARRADELLTAAGAAPLPERFTPHALRRTYCSIVSVITRDLAYVMEAMGHEDPTITTIYRKTISPTERRRIFELVGLDPDAGDA